MNLFGMGMTEMAIIFLVAFLALGPNRSIDMARTLGKVLGEIKRTDNEVTTATNINSDISQNTTADPDRDRPGDKETPQ
ncbi:MAG: twin-arginine translocase TatA/TatE family subunit [SAR202 cluster bacterium]|nr:twin-arginine translocase TatA/TatE family subunit [SAR202 cluster bacterium]